MWMIDLRDVKQGYSHQDECFIAELLAEDIHLPGSLGETFTLMHPVSCEL